MKYAFWPGCVSRGAAPELYKSTLAVAEHIGIELVELEAAACAGAGIISDGDPYLADTLNARTLAMAEQMDLLERRLRLRALRAQRLELYELHRQHLVGDEVVRQVLGELDMSEANLGSVR